MLDFLLYDPLTSLAIFCISEGERNLDFSLLIISYFHDVYYTIQCYILVGFGELCVYIFGGEHLIVSNHPASFMLVYYSWDMFQYSVLRFIAFTLFHQIFEIHECCLEPITFTPY